MVNKHKKTWCLLRCLRNVPMNLLTLVISFCKNLRTSELPINSSRNRCNVYKKRKNCQVKCDFSTHLQPCRSYSHWSWHSHDSKAHWWWCYTFHDPKHAKSSPVKIEMDVTDSSDDATEPANKILMGPLKPYKSVIPPTTINPECIPIAQICSETTSCSRQHWKKHIQTSHKNFVSPHLGTQHNIIRRHCGSWGLSLWCPRTKDLCSTVLRCAKNA